MFKTRRCSACFFVRLLHHPTSAALHCSKKPPWIDCFTQPSNWLKERSIQEHFVIVHAADEEGDGYGCGNEDVVLQEYETGNYTLNVILQALRSADAELIYLGKGFLAQPSVETCVHLLHFCKRERHLDHALRLHMYLQKTGLEAHNVLGNCLVSLLVEVGRIQEAQQVFDMLAYWVDSSYDSLILGYVKQGMFQNAIALYRTMQQDDRCLSEYTFVALLKACTQLKDWEVGCNIHASITKEGLLEKNIFIGSALVHMYAKCGFLAKAQDVFDILPDPNIVSWNTLIAGYVEHGHAEEALTRFEQMQLLGIPPNAVTFVCSVKACSCSVAIDKGQEIHAMVARLGFIENLFVGNTLVDMYATCGQLAKAQEVFDNLLNRDTVSWNVLIDGYAEHGLGESALSCFKQMQAENVLSNASTFVSVLKASGSLGAIDEGAKLHAEIAKRGLEQDLFVGSTLVDMYAKCGSLVKAQEVFDMLLVRDTIAWNALIAGYSECGLGQDALDCFEEMQLEEILCDFVTFSAVLKACGILGAVDKGQEIHVEIARNGLERDSVVGSALVDMYAKCGFLVRAHEVVSIFPMRNTVLWSALIGGYADHGLAEEALSCFHQMHIECISPNAITYVCVLKACGSIGARHKGQEIHADLAKKGLETDLLVGSTLVDMYGKCGLLAKAQEVFDKLPARNIVSWNALIAGYAQVGDNERVFYYFEKMVAEGEKPNEVTFLSFLTACCHVGEVERGETYFNSMSTNYSIAPTLEHTTCIVDLLGRAGQLGKAATIIKKMAMSPDLAVWLTLLGACEKWGNVEVGKHAFNHAVLLDEEDATAYACMSNIFSNAGMQEDANKVEAMRVSNQARNKTWLTDVGETVHLVFPEDERLSQSSRISSDSLVPVVS